MFNVNLQSCRGTSVPEVHYTPLGLEVSVFPAEIRKICSVGQGTNFFFSLERQEVGGDGCQQEHYTNR